MLRTDSQDCGLGLETTGTTRKDKLEGSTANYADWPWEITLPQAERLQRLYGKKKIPLAGDRSKTVPEPLWPVGGGRRIRTDGILLAKQTLYQLSYTPYARENAWWA